MIDSKIAVPVNNSAETILFNTTFPGTSLPEHMVASGWTVDNGLAISSGGGFDRRAYLNKYSVLDRVVLECIITFNTTLSTVGLFRLDSTTNLSGSLAEIVDGQFLRIYKMWNSSNLPVPVYTRPLYFPLLTGRDYKVSFQRIAGTIKFSIEDTVAGFGDAIDIEEDFNPFVGSMWGCPGVMYRRGSIVIKSFVFKTLFPQSPKVAIYGDSYVDGNSLRYIPGGAANRWSERVFNTLGGNCLLSGKGGDNSTGLLQRTDMDLAPFYPEYAILAIGFNDNDYTTWLTNTTTMIKRVQARGAIPVLSTFPPRADSQSFLNQVNDYILKQDSLPVADFAASLTLNGDRVNWMPAFLLDEFHPNSAGHEIMFQRLALDLPQLFIS